MSSPIDLRKLQNEAAHYFKEWDVAAADKDTKLAKEARKAIMNLTKTEIKKRQESSKSKGGLYLFANRQSECGNSDHIFYVGLVKAQTMAARMSNHLREVLSVLDPKLLELEEGRAEKTISARISKAMPNSRLELIERYTNEHLNALPKSRANAIFLFPKAEQPYLLDDAETILIRAADATGHTLVNIKKRSTTPTGVGRKLAVEAVEKWQSNGLGDDVCCALFAEIGKLGSS